MAQRRVVGSEEFNRAYYGDPADPESLKRAADNRNIIKAVLQKYQKQLAKEELESCGLHAMWRCLQYHREEFGQKFTTSLHRFTEWECRRELRRHKGGRKKVKLKRVSLTEDLAESREKFDAEAVRCGTPEEDLEHVVECMGLLEHDWQRTVIRQYHFEGMTMEQVGRANGYSKEAARNKIMRAVQALREICLESLGDEPGVLPG